MDLDPHAYVGLLRSALPNYLCLCMPMQREAPAAIYSTWWRFRQAEVLESVANHSRFDVFALADAVLATAGIVKD